MNQKDYWEEAAQKKQFTTPFQAEEFSKYVTQDQLIADIGCGYGRTLNELYQMGYRHLIGMDFSEEMIRRGTATYPYLNLHVMQAGRIDLEDQSVDAVILFAVLTCIVSDAEQEKLIQEIRRVLKPEGVIYINDFLLNRDARNLERYQKYQEKYGVYGAFELSEGAVLRHQDEAHMTKLLRDFEQLEYQHLTFTTMNGHTSNGFYYIGKKPDVVK